MSALQCKAFIGVDFATTETDPARADRLLRKQGFQICPNACLYSALADLLNAQAQLFGGDFAHLRAQLSQLARLSPRSVKTSPDLSAKLKRLLLGQPTLPCLLLEKDVPDHLSILLCVLAEMRGVKIRLFQMGSNALSCQRFGPKKAARSVNLVHLNDQLLLVDSVDFDRSVDFCSILKSNHKTSQSQDLDFEGSLEETGQCSPGKSLDRFG